MAHTFKSKENLKVCAMNSLMKKTKIQADFSYYN